MEHKGLFGVGSNRIFLFLVLLKNGGRGVSPRFYLFFSGVTHRNEEAGLVRDFLVLPQGWKDFLDLKYVDAGI